jgi:hypothetical protein
VPAGRDAQDVTQMVSRAGTPVAARQGVGRHAASSMNSTLTA